MFAFQSKMSASYALTILKYGNQTLKSKSKNILYPLVSLLTQLKLLLKLLENLFNLVLVLSNVYDIVVIFLIIPFPQLHILFLHTPNQHSIKISVSFHPHQVSLTSVLIKISYSAYLLYSDFFHSSYKQLTFLKFTYSYLQNVKLFIFHMSY